MGGSYRECPWVGRRLIRDGWGYQLARSNESRRQHGDDPGAEDIGFAVAIDGTAVSDVQVLQQEILQHEPGDTVMLTVNRGGEEMQVEVTLGESVVLQ